jgi:transcriptional regulator with XRE-family HTH domain
MPLLLSIDGNFAKEKTNYLLAIIRNLRIMRLKEVEIMRKNTIGIRNLFSAGISCVLANRYDGKQKILAEKLGMSPGSLNDYVKGRREGDEATRRKITDYLGVRYDGVFELGRKVIELSEQMKTKGSIDIYQVIKEVDFEDELDAIAIGTNDPAPGFTLVPKYSSRLSGCHGTLTDSDLTEANYAFRKDWIMRKGSDSLALFDVYDDSMAPFISGGDIVLVDLAENDQGNIIDGKAYAICEEATVKVRRLARQGGKLIIRSQNRITFLTTRLEKIFR